MTQISARPNDAGGAAVLQDLTAARETVWLNPVCQPAKQALAECVLKTEDILDAEARLARFASYFCAAFPETQATGGVLESPLVETPAMQRWLLEEDDIDVPGKLWLKCDNMLPVSGSIKARGGIYEILKFAEDVAIENGMLKKTNDYAVLLRPQFQELFGRYSIAVGSTGNLGLSIGLIAAKLGFKASVHMSQDAREWKKAKLRAHGCEVVEYSDDYSRAVKEGREQSKYDPYCYFVDDENSQTLFLGYAVAALRLQKQLEEKGVVVDEAHPLFVYLPCGVGGGPGGVAFGIKTVYGDAAHCFFAEPTQAPSMTLGLVSGLHDAVSVQDIGLDNKTAADGLAVGRASSFVGKLMEPLISGCATSTDASLFRRLQALYKTESIFVEPSAAAGYAVPARLFGKAAPALPFTEGQLQNATHIAWATGGSMVPPDEREIYLNS